jgi:hypothetical protein
LEFEATYKIGGLSDLPRSSAPFSGSPESPNAEILSGVSLPSSGPLDPRYSSFRKYTSYCHTHNFQILRVPIKVDVVRNDISPSGFGALPIMHFALAESSSMYLGSHL